MTTEGCPAGIRLAGVPPGGKAATAAGRCELQQGPRLPPCPEPRRCPAACWEQGGSWLLPTRGEMSPGVPGKDGALSGQVVPTALCSDTYALIALFPN